MTVNKNSSVGITEDIITNIMHLGASEYHLEILIRKYEDQIKFWYNIDTPDLQSEEDKIAIYDTKDKVNQITMTLQQVTEQRRRAMELLKSQANDKVKFVFLEQSRVANQVLAMFLGYEVTPCSACLTDQLKEDGK